MRKSAHLLLFFLLFFLALFFCSSSSRRAGQATAQSTAPAPVPVHVGVILDLQKTSLVGRMCNTSLAMAVEDFYATQGRSFKTRLVLHPKDSHEDVVGAASAALDLMKNAKVQAIIGPLTSVQSVFVIDLGNKAQVPIVSFSASSPSLSPSHSPYFVRTALSSSSQVEAIAAIVKAYGWREVVPIYEDTEYGAGFLPYLVDALQGVDAQLPNRSPIPPSASDDHIAGELRRLSNSQTRVFVVHMLPALGSRLFLKVQELGMMAKGYVWIITDGLTDMLGTLSPTVVEAMKGVIGLKPYVPPSKRLDNFTERWRERFRLENPEASNVANISTYALWAYDTVWAVAKAVDKVGVTNSSFQRTEASRSTTDLASLGVSRTGPRLLDALLKTKFGGVSGDFRLVDGQLQQSSTFQVLNVIGGRAREVGFWTPAQGVSPELNSTANTSLPVTGEVLREVVWPGDSRDKPKGWQIPAGKEKLKVAVPAKAGFGEFVLVDSKNCSNVTGFSIAVFDAVMKSLGYEVPYEYVPFDEAQGVSGSYDLLVQQVYLKNYDVAVGDITIVADRSQYVDFTLPYTESGVRMIVPIKEDKNRNAWIFLKPLTTDLWLASLVFFFFTGFVVWVIEHRINEEFRGPVSQQMGTIFYFAFSTMVYAHRERVESNLSRFVVIIWVFVVLILTSSYTASLTSMLTVQQLQPAVADVSELLKSGDYVGYQDGSFVKGLLKRLNFDESKLKPYVNSSQYADALSKGSRNGGVAAIFDELPYIKIFLAEHCSKFTMVGPTYKTDGFGFAFPRGSPLVPDISRAILNITEGDNKLQGIETWLGKPATCTDQTEAMNSSRLSIRSFWGLFLITGAVSILALLIFFVTFAYKNWRELKAAASNRSAWQSARAWAGHYDQKDHSSHTFREQSGAEKGCDCASRGRTPARSRVGDGSQSPLSISVHSFMNFGPQEEGRPSTSSDTDGGCPPVETVVELSPESPHH